MAIKYICKAPQCSTLVEIRGYCLKHAYMQREEDERKAAWSKISNAPRAEYIELYNTYKWKTARAAYLKEHPICCRCGADASVVDHIIAHRGDEELFWNIDNWQPLCGYCHNKKTRQEASARAVETRRGRNG